MTAVRIRNTIRVIGVILITVGVVQCTNLELGVGVGLLITQIKL